MVGSGSSAEGCRHGRGSGRLRGARRKQSLAPRPSHRAARNGVCSSSATRPPGFGNRPTADPLPPMVSRHSFSKTPTKKLAFSSATAAKADCRESRSLGRPALRGAPSPRGRTTLPRSMGCRLARLRPVDGPLLYRRGLPVVLAACSDQVVRYPRLDHRKPLARGWPTGSCPCPLLVLSHRAPLPRRR